MNREEKIIQAFVNLFEKASKLKLNINPPTAYSMHREDIEKKIIDIDIECFSPNGPWRNIADFVLSEIAAAEKRARREVWEEVFRIATNK